MTSLWRGTDRLTSLPPDTLVPPADGGPFAAAGSLTLADDLPAGTYVLQIAATSDDPKHAKRARASRPAALVRCQVRACPHREAAKSIPPSSNHR